ncbi:MAG: CocE/NonD family hydrolase, partial [Promethearchaeota archaeon]
DTLVKSRKIASKSKIEWSWFLFKEIILIIAGMLHVFLSVLITTYSIILSGNYLTRASKRSRKRIVKTLGIIFATIPLLVIPTLALILFSFMTLAGTDDNALVYLIAEVCGISGITIKYIFNINLMKKHHVDLNLEDSLRVFKRTILQKLPKTFKACLVLLIVLIPAITYLVVDKVAGLKYETVYIEMPDGVKLATDVYRIKNADGPLPVILIRTPYDKHDIYFKGNSFILNFLKEGYIVVYQDMRGRYKSRGNFIPFLTDHQDGAETIKWIKNQTWCDGNIATWGGSALAINQYYFADEPTGALKFQSIFSGTPDFHDIMVYQGGAFRKSQIESWLWLIAQANNPKRENEYNNSISWIINHPLKNESWNTTSLSINDKWINVTSSALHINGWYDIMSQGTLDGFVGYQYKGGYGARGKQRLIMGPAAHGVFGALSNVFNASTLHFPAADESGHSNWEQVMRDAALNGGYINWSEPSVAYYLMGDVNDPNVNANRWKYADKWPIDHVNTSLYIQDNNHLQFTNQILAGNYSFIYDPANPVPTRGGNNLMQIAYLEKDALGMNNYPGDPYLNRVEQFVGIGPYDQKATGILNRSDVLVFTSDRLSEPFTITGHVWVKLTVSSNCSDTAFTAMLLDEYPNGSAYNILDGIKVMRSRNGPDQEAPALIFGQKYEILIDLWSTAYQFNSNHKIMLAISSSNYPRFERHPNNNDPLSNHPSDFNIANNTIFHGSIYNSCVILPKV